MTDQDGGNLADGTTKSRSSLSSSKTDSSAAATPTQTDSKKGHINAASSSEKTELTAKEKLSASLAKGRNAELWSWVNLDTRAPDFLGSPGSLEDGHETTNRISSKVHAFEDSELHKSEHSGLKDKVEGEFIPRLMLSHTLSKTSAPNGARSLSDNEISQKDVDAFIKLVLNQVCDESKTYVDMLIGRGVDREAIYVDLFAVAARELGEMWIRDECDFTDVTLGLCRLHELLRERGTAYEIGFVDNHNHPTILLGTLDSDQHIFGIAIVAEFFRRAQWRVQCTPGSSCGELIDHLSVNNVDVLGLSLSGTIDVESVSKQIVRIRKASKNQNMRILIGGPSITENPSLVHAVGADDCSPNARMAPSVAANMLAANRKHC